jgi:DNA-binding response OmpR family regulator
LQHSPSDASIRVGPLQIQVASRTARLGQRDLSLTTTEFRLLQALAHGSGRVLSREELATLIGGRTGARGVDPHICRLRRKLGDDPRAPRLLRTIRESGYLLAAEREWVD